MRFLISFNINRSSRSVWSLNHASKNRNNLIPELQSSESVQSQSSIQKNDLRFYWTVRDCSLILAHTKNVWLPKTHNVPPEVDFESSRSLAKLESVAICIFFAVLSTWQYCLYSLVWWIHEINRFKRLSQALVHFVMDRGQLIYWP